MNPKYDYLFRLSCWKRAGESGLTPCQEDDPGLAKVELHVPGMISTGTIDFYVSDDP